MAHKPDWNNVYNRQTDFTLISWQHISKMLEYVDAHAPRTALDIGCGTGQLTRELYHRGFDVVGVDASESAIHIAQSLTVMPHQQLSYAQQDVERDNLDDLPHRPYGLITCKLVYAFLEDKPKFLKRMKSMLAPGGVLAIITPLSEDLPAEKRHITVPHYPTLDELRQVFSQVETYRGQAVMHYIAKTAA